MNRPGVPKSVVGLAAAAVVGAASGWLIGGPMVAGHDPGDFAWACTHDYGGQVAYAVDADGNNRPDPARCEGMTRHPAGVRSVESEQFERADPGRVERIQRWDQEHPA